MTVGPRPAWLDRLVWRFTAPVYDRLAQSVRPGRTWIANSLGLAGDGRVLLLGCGTGLDLDHLPDDVRVVAVDRSRPMVRRCRRRGAALGVDLETSVGDAGSLSEPDRSFDAVLVHLLLSVVDDPDAVIAEAARVLSAGGRLSILDEPTHPATDPSHERHEDPFRRAGLAIERSRSFGAYHATIATRAGPGPGVDR